jgi:methyl-accepting chemotaxis protein
MKIWHKVIVAPAVAMGFLVLFGAASYYALSHQRAALDGLRDNSFAAYRIIAVGEADLTEVHSGVYRLFTWIGNMDEKKIRETIAALKAKLDGVQNGLKTIGALPGVTEEERKALEALSAHITKYSQQVDTAVDLATVDVNTGMAAMQTADFTFQELRKDFRTQVETVQSTAETNFANAHKAASFATAASLGILLFALIGSAFAALIVARQISRPLSEAVLVADALSKGDLTQKIVVRSQDEVGQLMAAMKGTLEHLATIMQGIKESSDSITTAATEIALGNADLSQRTEEQAASLEETAASMEEMAATVKNSADNTKQANQLAVNASDVAVKGGQVVSEVVQTMASITDSSKKIVDIISVIDGIAFQTNILALNAAVEAARAGEQGRGFAVVAGEVRNLAQRSAAAAKEIKTLIGDSVDTVNTGSKLVDQAGTTMNEIVTAVKRVTDIMSEIAAASNEQSSGIEQVNKAIIEMDKVTQQNAALVEQASVATELMEEQANSLMEMVSIFKLDTAGGTMRRASAKPAIAHGASTATETVRNDRKQITAKENKDDWKEF